MKNRDILDLPKNEHDKETILAQFDWSHSALNQDQIFEMQNTFVEDYDIYAKHRFDVGYNTELKVKLTPADDLPVYIISPTILFDLKNEILVEIAPMQNYGSVTLLPISKSSSPTFAPRKPSRKVKVLIDLRRVNHLLRSDYSNNISPISNMTDAFHFFEGKTLLTKLDCSQPYHYVQMADPLWVQLLSFNFASKLNTYTRLAQVLSKWVTGFSWFVRCYFDTCLAAKLCTQFKDDIGSGVETFEQMVPALEQTFDCLRKSGRRLTPHKCEIGKTSIHIFGNTIATEGITLKNAKL